MNGTPGLPREVLDLIKALAARDDAVVAIAAQADAARAFRAGPTTVEIEVPDTCPKVGTGDGPLPGRFFVHDADGRTVGEILLWFTDGRISGLEQAWYTADSPASWPSPDRITHVND
jgi:hypothetical protein